MTNSNQEGQPVKMKSGKRGSNISLYVDLSEIEELDKIRWREHKSMSEIVRKAIDEYIEKHSEGNDSFRLDTWVNDSTFKAVPTILDKNKQKWIDYVNSCNESDRRDLCICCNSVLKIIASLEVKSDIQVSNNKSYDADRLRNSYDIRNKDPNTLTIYQREQLKRYLDVPRWYKQPHYVEIWTEKKAMINNLVPILRGKEVTIVPIAGFSSTPFLYDNFVRLSKQADLGKEVHVLYYGDFDPSGESISRDAKNRLQECMKRSGKHFDIDFQRIAVTKEQIEEYDLPQSLDDQTYEKLENDPRKDKFIEKHGELYQVELDSLPALVPDEFREMIINSVDQFYDVEIQRQTLREINKENTTDKLKRGLDNLMYHWEQDFSYNPHNDHGNNDSE